MDNLEFEFSIKIAKETKKYHKYLQEYSLLSDNEKKESRQKNKLFWNDLMSNEKLKEDIVPRKYPNPNGYIESSELPELMYKNHC